MKKSFVTIFPDTENFHLVKDVGQIPYFMFKTGEYDSKIVSYQNNSEYPYLENEVKGLKLSFIARSGRFFYSEISILKYIFTESKKIDVLNLFHFKKDNILYLLIYKFLNPRGKTYVKLDVDLLFFKNYNSFFFSNFRLKNYLLKWLTQLHFKLTDLFSIETDEAREYLVKVYPELKEKLICIPNGVDQEFISCYVPPQPFEKKENIMITVGRIGSFQKNSELFLESIRLTDLKGWKVYLIGEIEEGFKEYISDYFENYPHLKEQVLFTGNISDRKELFAYYNRAKIFCMTSRFEGFPIAFAEASFFGNYIISTPVSSSSFVTDNGRLGFISEAKQDAFSGAISNALSENFLSQHVYQEIRSFSSLNLSWQLIVKRITHYLNR